MTDLIVHQIWIQDPSGSRTFGLGEWLSVLSLLRNTPYRVCLHTNLEEGEAGRYDPYKIIHDRFHVHKRPFDLTVNGVRLRPANLSDIERIRIMYSLGGIYSDLDIWWLRPVDIDMSANMIIAYENPAYRTVTNAFMAAPRGGWAPLLQLQRDMLGRIASLAARGIVDLTGNPTRGISAHHTLLWKLTGETMKEHGAVLIGKRHFYHNGWRRIGRTLRGLGVVFKPSVNPDQLGTTNDKVSLVDIDGIHHFAELFSAEQVLQIPVVAAAFNPVLEWGSVWLG